MRKIVLFAFVLSLILVAIPVFTPEPVSAMTGSGTAEDPYIIWNCTDLQNISSHPNAYYELGQDIDCSCTATWNWDAGRGVYEGFDPINTFSGDFDGNYYTISSLCMNRSGETYVGIIADATRTTGSGTIRNVKILDASITALSTSGVGVVAGYSGCGSYTRVITSGSVYGTGTTVSAGGIVGSCFVVGSYHVNLQQCASYADVTAAASDTGHAGGLNGYGSITRIDNSYARGDVTAYGTSADRAGGLLGTGGTGTHLEDSYATGHITGSPKCGLVGYYGNDVDDCFYDEDTTTCSVGCTGGSLGDCGTGLNSTMMKVESTFTDAGWDFDSIWGIGGSVNDGYPYFLWWYSPYEYPGDFTQVVWFQPNAIIEGTELPNRAGASYPDGIFSWGANPAGIAITHGELVPEDEYDFEPIIPEGPDIIQPDPGSLVGDVCIENLRSNPLYPLVQVLSIDGFLNERLVWLGLAWFIVILSMFLVHIGPDTRKDSTKPHHFVLTTITGLSLSILFYVMCIFPLWVVILMSLGLLGAIIWERQPVI